MTISNSAINNTSLNRYIEITLIIFLVLFAIFLRTASLDYLDASDNYNDIAYKSIYENGSSYYKYSTISTMFTLFFINTFGFNFFSLRTPSVVYSLVTAIFIYFIARRINKTAAMISVFLFAVSPWSIVLSRVTRDYAFDCMISSAVIFFTILIIEDIHKKSESQLIINSIGLAISIFLIFLLTKFNNRNQTIIVIIFPLIGILFNFYYLLKKIIKKKSLFLSILFLATFTAILIFYYIDYANFKKGLLFNRFYLRAFFAPWIESPWQWFHGNNIQFAGKLFFLFFFVPLVYAIIYKKKDFIYFLFLYASFFTAIVIFALKFKTHINYNPTRYAYFIFPPYVIIYSYAFYYLSTKITKNNLYRGLVFCVALTLFININSLLYAAYPEKAYKDKNISTLKVDNIGIGQFKMNTVVKYLKEELDWNNEKVFVFGGRYGEFILLLDYKMDPDRYLLRYFKDGTKSKYDVGRNMYVESSYFGYHELKYAVNTHKKGYFVTHDLFITDSAGKNVIKLPEGGFSIYGSEFLFIKNVNNYKIYSWEYNAKH